VTKMSQRPGKDASADAVAGDKTTKQRRTIRVEKQPSSDSSSHGSATRDAKHVKSAADTANKVIVIRFITSPIMHHNNVSSGSGFC